MSRVADAYARAGGNDPAVDLHGETETGQGVSLNDALEQFDRRPGAPVPGDVGGFDSPADDVRDRVAATWPLSPPCTAPAESPENTPVITSTRPALGDRNGAIARNLAPLVERVFFPISGEPVRRVGFASTDDEADSGRVIATVAELLAERATRAVCVVDANFRMPALHHHFALPSSRGLAEALASESAIAASAQRVQNNLWVLPAGTARDRRSLATPRAWQRMSQFFEQFEYVLVNAEPIAPTAGVSGLWRLLGGAIVVVAGGSTRRQTARRATQSLTESGVVVVGAVLTNWRFALPDAINRLL